MDGGGGLEIHDGQLEEDGEKVRNTTHCQSFIQLPSQWTFNQAGKAGFEQREERINDKGFDGLRSPT